MFKTAVLDLLAKNFFSLDLFFEGSSRILRSDPDNENLLISRLKPTIFSFEAGRHVPLEGIDLLRTKLNAFFCKYLEDNAVKTSTLVTTGYFSLQWKEEVPPIEVIVKGALTGTPKHICVGIEKYKTRTGEYLVLEGKHKPHVRFDFRNEWPGEDVCIPRGLADHFIDTVKAEETALKAFCLLQNLLNKYDFDLLDICFFMNTAGDTICAEVSTDNTKIIYTGDDEEIKKVFADRSKENVPNKARILLEAFGIE
jgi:hypothetical protein